MPSTNDLIRFKEKVSTMDFKARTQLFNDAVKWLEEHGPGFSDTSKLDELIAHLKDAAKTEVLEDGWASQLTPQFGGRLYYEGVLRRMLGK
jgi:hypothetical protein